MTGSFGLSRVPTQGRRCIPPQVQGAAGDARQFAAEVHEHRDQRAEVHRDVERKPLVRPPRDVRDQDQVGGTRDRQELGHPLDDGEHHDLQEIHGGLALVRRRYR